MDKGLMRRYTYREVWIARVGRIETIGATWAKAILTS
jgi:hypothetical protein